MLIERPPYPDYAIRMGRKKWKMFTKGLIRKRMMPINVNKKVQWNGHKVRIT